MNWPGCFTIVESIIGWQWSGSISFPWTDQECVAFPSTPPSNPILSTSNDDTPVRWKQARANNLNGGWQQAKKIEEDKTYRIQAAAYDAGFDFELYSHLEIEIDTEVNC